MPVIFSSRWFRLVLPVIVLALLLAPLDLSRALPTGWRDVLAQGPWGNLGLRGGLALTVALLLVGNVWLVGRLRFRWQVIVAWVELCLLFLWFFYSFNLSYSFIWGRLPFLLGLKLNDGFLQGAAMTLFVSIASMLCASVLALIGALGRLSANGLAYGVAGFYISFFRGTPLLLQVMLIYMGLPQLGLVINAVPAGIIALSLGYGAYMAEIVRAGILSVPSGQREAAMALGLTPRKTLWLVILPQAVRVIIPPTGNQFISLLKDSALVSVMGVWELMYLARTHGRAEFRYMEMLIAAALIYWLLSSIFELLQARLERRFGRSVQR